MIDYSNKKPPYYTIDRGSLPAETQQRLLINAYLDEIEKVIAFTLFYNFHFNWSQNQIMRPSN